MPNQTKKAQGAMEFLMTYGWAILIVIVAIGALTYSGVLGGATFLPEKCTISTGSGLFCEDFAASAGIIILRVRNALPNPVTITEATITQDENSCILPGHITIPASSSTDLELTGGGTCIALTQPGEKLKGDISITFIKKQLSKTTTGDLLVKPGSGPIAVDTATSEIGEDNFISWEHTTGDGDNRLLIVGISSDKKNSVHSITYNDIGLRSIPVENPGDKIRTELRYLVNQSIGTYTINVNLNGPSNNKIVAGSISFTGVNQSYPISDSDSATGESTDATITLTSAIGNIVVGVIGQDQGANLNIGAGQTEQWEEESGDLVGAASTEVGTTTVVMEWISAGGREWAISTASINAVEE